MKTLLTLFSQSRSELQTKIDQATSLEAVVKLVDNQLDELERNYIGELSVSQVRLVSFALESLRQSINTITAINQTASNLETQFSSPATRSQNFIIKLLQGLISIGILGTLFSLSQTDPGGWMAILLVLLLVGLEVLQLNTNQDYPNFPREALKLNMQINSNVILENLGDALNTIDLAVASASDGKKSLDADGIEQLPELLTFLQRLGGASYLNQPQMTLELAKMLPQILMEQGIQTQIYRPGDEHSHREYFDFEPSIDRSAKDYITITPALCKGDRLLLRGRVIEPAKLIHNS